MNFKNMKLEDKRQFLQTCIRKGVKTAKKNAPRQFLFLKKEAGKYFDMDGKEISREFMERENSNTIAIIFTKFNEG